MTFEFATATRIVFGPGKLRECGPQTAAFGQRPLIVTGRSKERAHQLMEFLPGRGTDSTLWSIEGEPTLQQIEAGTQSAKSNGCDFVIGIGGGSAMDAAKAIAALLTNPGNLLEYLEVIGAGKALARPGAPCIAVPTTAGTGAEVTRNAVLSSPEHRFKVSLRSAFMLPRLALVDPELTYGLPASLTAFTGLDALTQLIEPFVSHRANPLTDGFCLEGMQRVARSLRAAVAAGGDPRAREDMALASLLSGLSLANAGLGAVHGFAAPLGGMSDAPHGALCAAMLPHVMTVNVLALRRRQPESEALRRYAQVARTLTGDSAASLDDGVRWVAELCRDLQIPPLKAYGIQPDSFPELVQKAAQASSMKANPIALTAEELTNILERSS